MVCASKGSQSIFYVVSYKGLLVASMDSQGRFSDMKYNPDYMFSECWSIVKDDEGQVWVCSIDGRILKVSL